MGNGTLEHWGWGPSRPWYLRLGILVFGTGDMDLCTCWSLILLALLTEMDIAFALLMQIVGALPHTPLLPKPIDVCLLGLRTLGDGIVYELRLIGDWGRGFEISFFSS